MTLAELDLTGADGHLALLSWAETAPDFPHAPVLVAVSIDGTPLDLAGPQPFLPQDRCGARRISGLTAIRVDGSYGVRRPASGARPPVTRRRRLREPHTLASRSALAGAGATGLDGLSPGVGGLHEVHLGARDAGVPREPVAADCRRLDRAARVRRTFSKSVAPSARATPPSARPRHRSGWSTSRGATRPG